MKRKKVKKLLLQAYYSSEGDYISWPDNPLHGKTYENVGFEVRKELQEIHGIDFEVDILAIEGEEPIECEYVSGKKLPDGTYVIGICQDWG